MAESARILDSNVAKPGWPQLWFQGSGSSASGSAVGFCSQMWGEGSLAQPAGWLKLLWPLRINLPIEVPSPGPGFEASLPLILTPTRTVPCPEQWWGDSYRPGQHCNSICWNHMCRDACCPSASLVSCQLERTDKSCTHFNGQKVLRFPFLLVQQTALSSPAPKAQGIILCPWKTAMKSLKKKICSNNQSWVSWVIN